MANIVFLLLIMDKLCIIRIPPNFQLGFNNCAVFFFLAVAGKSVGILSFKCGSPATAFTQVCYDAILPS